MTASGTGAPSPSTTRPSMTMRSPCAPAAVRSLHSGRSSPSEKNGPTVCDGVGINLSAMARASGRFERRRAPAAEHHVPAVAERPFRLAEPGVVLRDQSLARLGIGGALEDRVVGEERVAREIHLRIE